MKRGVIIAIILLSASTKIFSASRDTTKIRILSIGGGFIKTSLNFFKNYQEDTYSNGYSVRLMFQPSEVFRIAGCFSRVEAVNIQPTWLNVNNSFYDLDAHLIMHFRDKRNLAYFVCGLNAQYWSGFYTGVHDYNNFKLKAVPNTMYNALYFGGKLGMGVELKLFGPISGYGEFLFRITKTDVGFGLSDVVYGLGLKINVANLLPKKHRHHKSILRFRDKYHWF